MASLANMSIPGVGLGILHPLFKNKWRIDLGGKKLIAFQSTRLEVDMVASTVTLYVEQPIGYGNEMLNEINDLAKGRDFKFSVDFLDGAETICGQISGFAKIKSHKFNLDYSDAHPAEHIIVLKYTPSA